MEYQTKVIEHGLEWICGSGFEPKCPDCMSMRYEFLSAERLESKDSKVYHVVKLRCGTCHCQYMLYRAEK